MVVDRPDTDVTVVGGGLSGLTAARNITRSDYNVEVLEARDRVGGRTFTMKRSDGREADLGGHWVGDTQNAIMELCDEYGIETVEQYTDGAVKMRATESMFEGEEVFSKLPDEAPDDFERVTDKINKLSEEVPLDAPHEAERAEEWDSFTVKAWAQDNFETEEAYEAFEAMFRVLYAEEMVEISHLWYLWHVHAGGGCINLIDPVKGALEEFISGSQKVSQAIYDEIGEENVSLNSPVDTIEYGSSGVRIHSEDKQVESRYLIVAGSPTMANRIKYEPELPASRDELNQRMPNGTVIKAVIAYETPFWRDQGLTGEFFDNNGPVTAVMDISPPDGTGRISAFVCGKYARKWHDRDPDERQQKVLEEIAHFYDNDEALNPVDYVDKSWNKVRWTSGCYVGHAPAGVVTGHWEALREPVGPIHWAGSETAKKWPGHMDGAVRSGKRAADEVLDQLE